MKDAWIQTFSGKAFFPFDPRPDQIDIEDIAHALSNICRFTGHTDIFYSVAEHSVRVARLVEPEYRLAALLHDASEAYLSDISAPIKPFLPDYVALEKRIEKAIAYRFSLPYSMHPSIKEADRVMLHTEAKFFMGNPDWAKGNKTTVVTDLGWGPRRAKRRFLEMFREYSR